MVGGPAVHAAAHRKDRLSLQTCPAVNTNVYDAVNFRDVTRQRGDPKARHAYRRGGVRWRLGR